MELDVICWHLLKVKSLEGNIDDGEKGTGHSTQGTHLRSNTVRFFHHTWVIPS
jgi:hypothetical protein